MLSQNQLTTDQFSSQLFDPDFFEKYNFPDAEFPGRALTFRRFMRNSKYGASLHKHAILDIRFNGSKVYTGTLQNLIGSDTLFPLITPDTETVEYSKVQNLINIVSIEESSGLIFQFHKNISDFNVNDLALTLVDFTTFRFATNFRVKQQTILSSRSDSLVRGRSVFIL